MKQRKYGILSLWKLATAISAIGNAAHTLAAGLRVPSAIGDTLILRAVHESSGTALSFSDDAMMRMAYYVAQQADMLIAIEAAAMLAAYAELLATHFLTPEDETVMFFTSSGLVDVRNSGEECWLNVS